MPIASLLCPAPIRRRQAVAPRDYPRRDQAIGLFERQSYREAIAETLAYLLPGQPIPDLAVEELCFVQGSARVRVRIEADQVVLSTTLAALLPEAHETAALRYFLTRISATGQLFQPRLRGDVVSLEFREHLALMHPAKLVEVLMRMPTEADSNDGWMVDEFGVSTPDREPVAALDTQEFERALEIWSTHWATVDELMLESRRRRSVRFLDALSSYTVNQIRYTLPIFGTVRSRLNDAASDFADADEAPGKRDAALAKCSKEMARISSEQLRGCLGHARYAINPLHEGTPSILSAVLGGDSMQTTGKLRATGRSLEAALPLFADYLHLLAEHSWPVEVETTLRNGLDLASGKSWREAADLLWNHANATLKQHGSHGTQNQSQGDDEDAADADAGPDDAPTYGA